MSPHEIKQCSLVWAYVASESPLALTVVTYGRLTSVRVRCDRDVDVHDEPFGVRERLLAGLTFAFGRRGRPDGSVDLWAEIVTS